MHSRQFGDIFPFIGCILNDCLTRGYEECIPIDFELFFARFKEENILSLISGMGRDFSGDCEKF